MLSRKIVAVALVLLVLAMSLGNSLVNVVSAEGGQKSVYDEYFPSRESLNFSPDDEEDEDTEPTEPMLYEKFPMENYFWDTTLSILKWKLMIPSIEDTGPIMTNNFAGMLLKISNGLTRTALFVFEFTFDSNFIVIVVEKITDAIIEMKDIFFDKFYGMFSLVLVTFIILAYARGLNGLAFKHLFVSLLMVALLSGIIENIDYFIKTGANVSNSVSSYVIGTVNLAPFEEEDVTDLAEMRMIATSNELWRVNVLYPWSYAQFGSINDPLVTADEKKELKIDVNTGDSWTELMLSLPPKEETREEIVEVLADPEIEHSPNLNPRMFGAVGAGVRLLSAGMSVLTAFLALVLFLAVGGLLLFGSFIVLVGVAFMPFFAVVPLLASIGTSLLKKYFSLLIAGFALEISAAFYLGSIILAKQIVHLMSDVLPGDFLIIQFLYMVIYIFGIVFSPKILTMLMPALYRIGTFQKPEYNQKYPKSSKNSYKDPKPENSEEVIERNKNYGRNKTRTANAVDFVANKGQTDAIDYRTNKVPTDGSSDRAMSTKQMVNNGKKYQVDVETVFDSMPENRKQALKGLQQEHADVLTTQKVSVDNPDYYGETNPISDKLDQVEIKRLEQAIEKEIHAQIKEDIRTITSRKNFRPHHLRDEIYQLADEKGNANNKFAEMKIRKLEREYSKQYRKFLSRHVNGDQFKNMEGDVLETSQRIRDLG